MNNNYRNAPQLEILKPQNELRKLRTGDAGNKNPKFHFVIVLILVGAGVYFATQANKPTHQPNNQETKQDTTTEEMLIDFVKKSIEEKTEKKKGYIVGKVTPKQAAIIKEITEQDVSKFQWEITNYDIKHITNRHPEIKETDFLRLYRTINTFDSLYVAKKQKKAVTVLEMIKTYEHRFTLLIELRKKKLTIITMYRNKLKKHK